MRVGPARFPSFPSTRSTSPDQSAIKTAKALGLTVPDTQLRHGRLKTLPRVA